MLMAFDIKYQHKYMKSDLPNVPNSIFRVGARQQAKTFMTVPLAINLEILSENINRIKYVFAIRISELADDIS